MALRVNLRPLPQICAKKIIHYHYSCKFNSTEHARQWCSDDDEWTNYQQASPQRSQRYAPAQVFTGSYQEIAKTKQQSLDAVIHFPERLVKGCSMVKLPPKEVAINPISADDIAKGVVDALNFPTLSAAGYRADVH